MESTNIRNLFTLYWRKAVIAIVFMASPVLSQAQFNAWDFDARRSSPLHFGILLGYNSSTFHINRSPLFTFNDTIATVESTSKPGLNLGMISNFKLSNNFSIRFTPNMSFSEKNLFYTQFNAEPVNQSIESYNVELPLLFKFRSNPYKDIRLYVIGGGKYSYDLASNAKARNAENMVKINRHDFHIDYGFGMEIYFPMFILAPEIRMSQGLFDLHFYDPALRFSNVLDRLRSRMIVFTLNFEG